MQLRLRVLAGYGNLCACCGETDLRFLTIDHVDGGGGRHRRSLGGGSKRVLLEIVRKDFPPEYQVLCFNCNFGRSINGGICPHDDPIEGSSWLLERTPRA